MPMPTAPRVLYIDRHLVHEVTSPQAFEGLQLADRQPWRLPPTWPWPTTTCRPRDRDNGIADPISRLQVETLDDNAKELRR